MDNDLNALVAKANATVGDERCNAWKAVQRRALEKHYVLGMAGQSPYWFARQGFDFAPESSTNLTPTSLRSPTK